MKISNLLEKDLRIVEKKKLWFSIPAAIVLFAFLLSETIGITGVWLAFPASEIFTLIIGILLYGKRCYGLRKHYSSLI